MKNNRENPKNKGDGFYVSINDFGGAGGESTKHKSPTKRLMDLKNSTFEHKKSLHKNV